MENKPKKENYHAGCLIHDDICLTEQLKEGCTVDLFICFNCEYLFESDLLDEAIKESNFLLGLLEGK